MIVKRSRERAKNGGRPRGRKAAKSLRKSSGWTLKIKQREEGRTREILESLLLGIEQEQNLKNSGTDVRDVEMS